MNTFKRSALGVFALVAVSAAAAGIAGNPGASSDLAALQAVDQAWVKAYNAGEVDGVTKLYANDAILMPPGAPGAHGRAAIHAFFASDIPASQKAGVTFHLTGQEDGGVSLDWGWCSGTYSVTDKSGKVVDAGKYLSVSHKDGGVWRYVRDTWNSDGAAPAAPAADAHKQ